MKKIYKYTIAEEEQINIDLGYTAKELNRICSKKQYQYTLGLSELSFFLKFLKRKKCNKCASKLMLIKECTYVGLRHPPQATGGDYERTYDVVYKQYCPNCQTIID